MRKKENTNEEDNINNDQSADKNEIQNGSGEVTGLQEKLKELEKQVEEYKDKVLRKAAEFENYKKRTENEQLNLFKYAAESFIIKLLPVIDDFERSIQHIDTSKDIDSVKQGIHLVYDKFLKLLETQGVKKIDAVGKPFDVHFHEAIMQKPDDKAEPHTVLDEIESGYVYKDRVIRHSKVIVSDDSSGIQNTEE